MSIRMITTRFATLVYAGVMLSMGCGGGDSPTQPAPTPPTPPPPPPPAPTVSVVEVSPNMATLEVGRTQSFVATAKASDGTVISGVDFTWSSNNSAVVTINNNGVATAVAAGSATIRATGNGVSSASVPITVTVAAVANVTVSPSSTQELMIGEMVTFTATARTAGGATRGDVSISWASSDTSVVSITSSGVATAVGAGTAMVRATAEGITSSPVTINVAELPPPEPVIATVTVDPSEAMIETDATQQFSAKALTSDGMEIPDVEFMWSSSDDMVATVDADGLATGVGSGEAMITATADSVSGMAMLTVTEPPSVVDRVAVEPESATIEEGETQRFIATAYDSDDAVITGTTFRWRSSNPLTAIIDTTGLATAVNAGSTTITATADSIPGSAMLTVTEPPPPPSVVDRVEVSPSSRSIEEGETQRFTATAYTSDNEVISGKTFSWTSSNTTVATVNPSSGTATTATGVNAGSTTIRAEVDGESGSARLTVTEPPPPPPVVDRVAVSPSSASIEEGETQRFTATAYTSDNEVISGKTFSWTSSNTTVATVNPSSGTATTATGVNAGSTTIRASVDGESGTAMLTVTEPPPPPPVVDRVAVSPSSPSIEEGETQRFTATAYTSDNEVISGKTFSWTSSNTTVATVSPSSGTATTATGVTAGSTTIRASVDGESGTAMLTVTEPPPPPPVVDRVAVSPSSASIEEGETQRFTATAYTSDNEVISGKTFSWTSSNTTVATVSPSSGTATTATGVTAGSTTIRASVDGESGTAMLTVTAPPPPQFKKRTASISGTSSYPSTAGSVTFEEVAGGQLKLTVTGMDDGGGVQAYLFLYTSSSISWRTGNAVPDGARNFGNVTNDSSFSSTFTPATGETIDSYSHVILHCALVNMKLGSGSLSN